MFKKLKQKVAEDPTLGLADSSGKATKVVVPPGSIVPSRPTKTIGLSSDDDEASSKSPISPGCAIRLQDSSLAQGSKLEHSSPTPPTKQENVEDTHANIPVPSQQPPDDSSRRTVLAMQEQLTYLQQRLTDAEAKESAAALERDHGDRQLSELRKQVVDLSSLLVEHQSQYKACHEELSMSKQDLSERSTSIERLRQECSTLSEKLSASEVHSQGVTDSLSQLTSRCKELEDKSAATGEQLKAVGSERDQIRATRDTEHQESVTNRRELLTTQEQCRQLQAQLSTQQSLHSEEVAGLRDRLSAIGQQFAESNHPEGSQVAAIAAERDDVEKRLSDVRKQLAEQRAESDERIGKLEILNQERDSDGELLQQKLDNVERSLQEHVTVVAELRDSLKLTEAQLQSAEKQSELQISALQSQVRNAEEQQQRAKMELDQQKELSESSLKAKETRIDELSEQLTKAHGQFAEATMKSSSLVSELESQLAQLQTARDIDKTTVESKLASMRQECSELRRNVADSRKQVTSMAKERAVLDADLTAAVASLQSRNQCVVMCGRVVGHTVNPELAESSLYSDADGKLIRMSLDKWREELTQVLDFMKESLSNHESKCRDQEEESRRLANSLELEQYSHKQLQDELSAAKTSLEEATAVPANHDAAVLSPSSSTNGGSYYAVESVDSSKPALMTQSSGTDAIAELTTLHQQVADLQEERAEKNQTVKQQQQLLADLRKQLQRQLGKPAAIKPSPPRDVPMRQASSSSQSSVKLLDPVNDIYLKNVILRYMCSTDWEAQHLIKAISTLLGFSSQEEQLVRDYFSYKTSWFGAKPGLESA